MHRFFNVASQESISDVKPFVGMVWNLWWSSYMAGLLGVLKGYTLQVSGFSTQPIFVERSAKPCHALKHWVVENRILIVGLLSYWSTSEKHLKSKRCGCIYQTNQVSNPPVAECSWCPRGSSCSFHETTGDRWLFCWSIALGSLSSPSWWQSKEFKSHQHPGGMGSIHHNSRSVYK